MLGAVMSNYGKLHRLGKEALFYESMKNLVWDKHKPKMAKMMMFIIYYSFEIIMQQKY